MSTNGSEVGAPLEGGTCKSIGATLLAGNAVLRDLVALGADSPELGVRSVEVKQMAFDLEREVRLLLDSERSRGKRLTVGMANALGGVFDLMLDSIDLLVGVIAYHRGRASVSVEDIASKVRGQLTECMDVSLREFKSSLAMESEKCVQKVVNACKQGVDVSVGQIKKSMNENMNSVKDVVSEKSESWVVSDL
ncbi:hypothetical protein LSTR_LSTR015426 [Laodelphax striatellus]|uniref:Uncharacterized protein n=1 Tax=Laodelphax striatellus TaxID=195883 RepID=A0A482X7Q4_LAOST|nr:hypothetical protein LSTR_LSTR015426 [Laodelphax striatellus]